MRNKARGYQYERRLVEWLWKNGFGATRIPASGSASKRPLPDIIAGNGIVYLAIEIKSRKTPEFRIYKNQVSRLYNFAKRFGAVPLIVMKIPYADFRAIIVDRVRDYVIRGDEFYRCKTLSEIIDILTKHALNQ